MSDCYRCNKVNKKDILRIIKMSQFISEMAHIRILTEKFSIHHIILRCKGYKSNKEWLWVND